jgi:hypothetical protein
MGLLLKEWKLALIAVLSAVIVLLYNLWQSEVKDFAEFKGAVVVLGQEAEKEAKRVNALHEQTLKETRDEWNKQLPGIRNVAIDNYIRRFPRGLCGSPSGGKVPGSAHGAEASDGTKPERVASGETTGSAEQDTFVAECAKDAGKLRSLRSWVVDNKLPIEK